MGRKQVNVRLGEEAEELAAAAEIEGMSQNEFIRQAIFDRIQQRKADPAFQARLAASLERHRAVMDRLAQT